MKIFWLFEIGIFCFLFSACSLNATQEQSFNQARSNYIEAINTGSTITVVSLTHPCLVAAAKSAGKENFKALFSAENLQKVHIGAARILKISKSENQIHILFEAEVRYLDGVVGSKKWVGISEDAGVNWFFMPHAQYLNEKNCAQQSHLLR